jgi:PAS domain S-box-containing protein
MNSRRQLELLIGVGLLVAVLVATASLAYRNITQMRADANLVTHTHQVLDELSQLYATVRGAESGQRGFLITGEESYLAPYRNAAGEAREQLRRLSEMTSDNPAQQKHLAGLTQAVESRFAALEESLDIRRRQRLDAARQVILAGEGQGYMRQLRQAVNAMERHERELLKDREELNRESYQQAVLGIIVSAVLGLAAVSALMYLLRRYLDAEKAAAEAVRDQRELLQATLASISDAVIATDARGRVTFLNGVAQQLTGWSLAEATGTPLEEVFRIYDEQTRSPLPNPAERALREEIVVGLANHTMLMARDGTLRPIDDSAAPIRNSAGRVAGAVLVFRDVSDRRQREESLGERMRLLALSADIGLALTQSDSLRLALAQCANALVEHVGCGSAAIWKVDSEASQLELQALAGPIKQTQNQLEVLDLNSSLVGRITASHDSLTLQERDDWAELAGYRTRIHASTVFICPLLVSEQALGALALFDCRPLPDYVSEALRAIATELALGIDRKRSEEAIAALLVRESVRSRRLQELAGASVALNSANLPENVLEMVHAEAKRIIGAEQADVRLQQDREPMPEAGLVAELPGRGDKRLGYIQLQHKSEGAFTPDDRSILLQLAQLAAVALENARLTQELREADRRKDEFLAMLAHELRNPLAPIRTAVELLTPDADPETMTFARGILARQVEHIVRLVDDLLDVSRVMQGKVQLRRAPVELRQLIGHVVDELKSTVASSQQELVVELPSSIVWVDGDSVRISQIVSNLLANAVKFTPVGGTLTVNLQRDGAEAVITVADTGSGIERDMLEKIFEPFTQIASSLDRSRGGLGIGLALVKSLAELHGGSVVPESEGVGRGSRFIVRLPAMDAQPVTHSPSSGATPVEKRKVLVVDDNQGAAQILGLLLRKMWQHDVQLAFDGLAAIETAKAFRPDVMLLDIGLPGLSGYEVAMRLRQMPELNGVYLVALTGYGQQEDQRRSREAGFDLHLVKPVSVDALQRVFDGQPGGSREPKNSPS